MDFPTLAVGAALLVAGVLVLWMALWVFRAVAWGAFILFALAAAQGFLGVAAYFAAWAFLLPFMLVATFVVGTLAVLNGGARTSD